MIQLDDDGNLCDFLMNDKCAAGTGRFLGEAQRRLIRDGEAMPIENHLQLNDETEESQPDSGEEE